VQRHMCWMMAVSMVLMPVVGALAAEESPAGPVQIKPLEPIEASTDYRFESSAGPVVAQSDNQGRLWSWGTVASEGGKRVFKPASFPANNSRAGVKITKAAEGRIDVNIDGKLFTSLHYDKSEPKPFLWPVIGPYGNEVTRAYPMKELDTERQDHWHHRSIWAAWGEVRTEKFAGTTNYWHQTKDPADQDRQVVKRIVRTESGPVFGVIEMEVAWTARNGQREFSELRTYTFYRGDEGSRMIDVKNVFKFDDCDVTFGDTKEAGILSVRIATSMDEIGFPDRKKPGKGHMTNSNGGKGSDECWGKAAAWCDYVGPVKGNTVGIAIFDDPKNMGHPTRWHIRNYGLYAANPIAVRPFVDLGKKATEAEKKAFKALPDTSKTWRKGESEVFNYRIVIHKGDTACARVGEQYKLYTSGDTANMR